jgi:hypothetical protein
MENMFSKAAEQIVLMVLSLTLEVMKLNALKAVVTLPQEKPCILTELNKKSFLESLSQKITPFIEILTPRAKLYDNYPITFIL